MKRYEFYKNLKNTKIVIPKNKSKSLSWEDFQTLGNPNSPELKDVKKENPTDESYKDVMKVRIWLDKKNRRGKKATLIKGLELEESQLKALCKEIKNKCGVGGAAKDGEIIIQGDQRQKILDLLVYKGYSKTKLAGG